MRNKSEIEEELRSVPATATTFWEGYMDGLRRALTLSEKEALEECDYHDGYKEALKWVIGGKWRRKKDKKQKHDFDLLFPSVG